MLIVRFRVAVPKKTRPAGILLIEDAVETAHDEVSANANGCHLSFELQLSVETPTYLTVAFQAKGGRRVRCGRDFVSLDWTDSHN